MPSNDVRSQGCRALEGLWDFFDRGDYVNRVALEVGKTSTFAIALEWPGWCRRAKHPDEALEALDGARERYQRVVRGAGPQGAIRVVGTVEGDTTTDFGAPSIIGPWDDVALSKTQRRRFVELLDDCWDYFDRATNFAPNLLRKGPRGGGRDRQAMVDHVREAERAYARRLGQPVAPRTPWEEQRVSVRAGLWTPSPEAKWPISYAARRIAWHVLDHAWEMEDRGNGPTP